MEENQNLTPPQKELQSNKIIKKRDPAIAVVLGYFFMASGQIYSGYLKRGIFFFSINILLLLIAMVMFVVNLIWAIAILIIEILFRIFSMVDAYRCAKKQNPNYELKWFNRWYIYLSGYAVTMCIIICTSFILKIVFIQAYRIPTSSMENTILTGDYLVADKTSYWNKTPERNDITVYLYENNKDEYFDNEDIYYVKRVAGMPGETIKIVDKNVYIDDKLIPLPPGAIVDSQKRPAGLSHYKIFPTGSGWNEDNYGPLYIPKKGDIYHFTREMIEPYKVFIFRDAGLKNLKELDELVEKILKEDTYIVKKNYYFMLGDNRNNSVDSRFHGFVPEESLIGKLRYIYFSIDDDEMYNIRWDRIGMEIK